MQFYYGKQNLLRALDEAEFWIHQQAEHTTVIQLVTPGLETEFAKRLKEFERDFNSTHSELIKYTESVVRSIGMFRNNLRVEMINLINQSILQSEQFNELLGKVLQKSEAVQKSTSSQIVINHIIRESQYFIGIDQLIL